MIKNSRGLTMIEILVAVAILIIGSLAIGSIYNNIRFQINQAAIRFGKKLQVRNVAVNIASNLANYQISFAGQSTQSTACSFLNPGAGMPLRWNRSEILNYSNCSVSKTKPCPEGQAGYIIEPFPNSTMRGLYLVTVRLTHPVLTKGSTGIFCGGIDSEEYQFVVGLR